MSGHYKTLPTGTIFNPSTTMVATTSNLATCKYATSDIGYDSMSDMFDGENETHNDSLILGEGDYEYYIACRDTAGNTADTESIELNADNGFYTDLMINMADEGGLSCIASNKQIIYGTNVRELWKVL